MLRGTHSFSSRHCLLGILQTSETQLSQCLIHRRESKMGRNVSSCWSVNRLLQRGYRSSSSRGRHQPGGPTARGPPQPSLALLGSPQLFLFSSSPTPFEHPSEHGSLRSFVSSPCIHCLSDSQVVESFISPVHAGYSTGPTLRPCPSSFLCCPPVA